MIQTAQFPRRVLLGLTRPFIVGSHPDTNAPEVIGPLWGEMSKLYFSMSLDRSTNPIGVGAMWPDLAKGPGHMIYFASYEVESLPADLGGLDSLQLDEANYAFVEHLGPIDQLPSVINNFYTDLLPSSGFQRRAGMDLEIYEENADPSLPTKVTIAAPVI